MSAILFLLLMFCLAGVPVVWHVGSRMRRTRRLGELAGQVGMHYSAADRFRLGARLADKLPVPGAAEIRVFDVLYRLEAEHYRYVCSAEYTVGAMRAKRRQTCIVSITEPRDRGQLETMGVQVAAVQEGSVLDRYRFVAESGAASTAPGEPVTGTNDSSPPPRGE